MHIVWIHYPISSCVCYVSIFLLLYRYPFSWIAHLLRGKMNTHAPFQSSVLLSNQKNTYRSGITIMNNTYIIMARVAWIHFFAVIAVSAYIYLVLPLDKLELWAIEETLFQNNMFRMSMFPCSVVVFSIVFTVCEHAYMNMCPPVIDLPAPLPRETSLRKQIQIKLIFLFQQHVQGCT